MNKSRAKQMVEGRTVRIRPERNEEGTARNGRRREQFFETIGKKKNESIGTDTFHRLAVSREEPAGEGFSRQFCQ